MVGTYAETVMTTTKPISIIVIGMESTPALEDMRRKGHHVYNWTYGGESPMPFEEYDMIVGPKCWRYLPDISDKFLPLLVKEARAKQPKRVKKKASA